MNKNTNVHNQEKYIEAVFLLKKLVLIQDQEKFPCPRCGKDKLKGPGIDKFSRRIAMVRICKDCTITENKEDLNFIALEGESMKGYYHRWKNSNEILKIYEWEFIKKMGGEK